MRRDVSFDESSMMKTPSSRQVEGVQTKGISQLVESDVSPSSLHSSVSFKVPSFVTQYGHHVHEEEDTKDVIEDPEQEGQVQNSVAAHKLKRNIRKTIQFSDMMVAYALSVEVVEDSVPSTFRETELSFESDLWRNVMMKEIESLHVNNIRELAGPKGRRPLDANEFLQRTVDLHMLLCVTKPVW